jgi:hypothetical protein
MNCPACGKQLVAKTVGDLTVDACDGGCGGLWFDQLELRKVDDQDEATGEALLAVRRDPKTRVDPKAPRNCPKCRAQPMVRHFYSVRRAAEVDECPKCGGYWLDAGELAAIRSQFKSNEERQAAAHQFFRKEFAQRMTDMAREDDAGRAKVRRIAGLFRFICPSYYLPGDQSWGGF